MRRSSRLPPASTRRRSSPRRSRHAEEDLDLLDEEFEDLDLDELDDFDEFEDTSIFEDEQSVPAGS